MSFLCNIIVIVTFEFPGLVFRINYLAFWRTEFVANVIFADFINIAIFFYFCPAVCYDAAARAIIVIYSMYLIVRPLGRRTADLRLKVTHDGRCIIAYRVVK